MTPGMSLTVVLFWFVFLLLCHRSEVTGLPGRHMGLLLLWCSVHAAGHLLSCTGIHNTHTHMLIFSLRSRVLTCVCPQGKEPSVRQLALLHFRNIITLNLKLDEALSRPRARVPPSIIQMLLILQVRLSLSFPFRPPLPCNLSHPQTHTLRHRAITDKHPWLM